MTQTAVQEKKKSSRGRSAQPVFTLVPGEPEAKEFSSQEQAVEYLIAEGIEKNKNTARAKISRAKRYKYLEYGRKWASSLAEVMAPDPRVGRDYLTYPEFKEMFHIKDDKTMDTYLRVKAIPEPVALDGGVFFERKKIYDIVGLKQDPNEPFITSPKLAEILGMPKAYVAGYIKKRKLPFYQFVKSKGGPTYYLRSEIEAAIAYQIKWSGDFINLVGRSEQLRSLFATIVSPVLFKGLTEEEARVFQSVILRGKSYREAGKELKKGGETIKRHFALACQKIESTVKELSAQLVQVRQMAFENADLKLQNALLKREIEKHLPGSPVKQAAVTKEIDWEFISVRLKHLFEKMEVKTLHDVTQFTRAKAFTYRDAGKKTIEEIDELLRTNGLWWKDTPFEAVGNKTNQIKELTKRVFELESKLKAQG